MRATVFTRRELEEQLRQSQKMAALGQLASGVAHDFNNHLTVILAWAATMKDQLPPDHPLREAAEEIRSAGVRAAKLTRQLLGFTRQRPQQVLTVDVGQVLSELAKMLERLINEDVRLVVRVPETPALVMADPGQVEQIIVNLAVNARDAMPNGGRLSISVDRVEPAAGERFVRICVVDDGVGMDAETKARIFEPFFTTKDQGKGTGLGLATVQQIVERYDGRIDVDSEPGRGTSFCVDLRAAPEDGATGPTTDLPAAECPPGTVLVVEDDDTIRRIVERLLVHRGFRVLTASNADEAYALATTEHVVDLVLTDVVMPGEGGAAIARRVLRRHPNARVLYMSGYMDGMLREAGVDELAFLAKPFPPERLYSKIAEVMAAPPVGTTPDSG
ncbi:ATP-binding protein [Myxococcota bacterium]|nr:ATP-binding protein [Myxococcota bacterium]